MKLLKKTRYSVRIIVELASRFNQGPIHAGKIASFQNIPIKYLEQLLRAMKIAGIVKSVRGPKGGHYLALNPKEISLGFIVRLFEKQTDLVNCISSSEKCSQASVCLVRDAWNDATIALYEKLDSIRIGDLIDEDLYNKRD